MKSSFKAPMLNGGSVQNPRPRIVLFTEQNSPFGERFLHLIHKNPQSELLAVVTREHDSLSPDYEPNAGDVSSTASMLGIQVLKPRRIDDATAALEELDADYFIIANYQLFVPRRIYELPKRGFSINFHVGPLPRYAGLIPWHWMHCNRELEGGVVAIRVDDVIDGGDIIDELPVRLSNQWNEREIRNVHFEAAYALLLRLIPKFPYLDPDAFRRQDLNYRTYYNRDGLVESKCGNLGKAAALKQLQGQTATDLQWKKGNSYV